MKYIALVLVLFTQGCSTRIIQSAGGDALVTISTRTEVSPAAAVGNNPVASVNVTEVTTRR